MAAPLVPSRRILLLLLATAVVLMTVDSRGSGPIGEARGAVISITAPIRSGITWVFSPINAAWNGMVHYDDVSDENAELRSRIAELEGSLANVPDDVEELTQLKAALGIEGVEQMTTVVAAVVQDRNTAVERIIEIDRGSADGIGIDMAVVTGQGLVGRIVEVLSDHRSIVRLITDGRESVGVTVRRTGGQGVASGAGSFQPLDLDLLIDSRGEVRVGDIFQTSGYSSSRYPGGVAVGRLITDETTGKTLLTPLADLDRLVYLSVIIDEGPQS